MKKVYFKENFDIVLEKLANKKFYIFGNTLYAHIFYLHCKEKNVDQNIKAFILSDINNLNDNRKLLLLHGVPIRDISWLKNTDTEHDIFLAAKEKTVQKQLVPMLQDEWNGSIYYVSDFVNLIMYCYYMSYAYKEIIMRYRISVNSYEIGSFKISDKRNKYFYNYTPRIFQGVLPDLCIFYGSYSLDELHYEQLCHYSYINKKYKKIKSNYRCKIYLARSHFDKELGEEFYTPFTENLQVGADLTDTDISELKDNTGDNISERNRDYCEMSAVYWAWKNDKSSDYIGLCHYRRRFVVDEDMLNYIMAENYDAVYTIPQLIDGGLREEFVERNYFLTPEMWDLTESAIKKLCPEYLTAWQQLETSYFLLAYNMFIMRRDIFEDYCSWVFSILEEVDRYYLDQGIQRNDRYLGYIAELLNTVYAMKHKDTLKKGYVYMKMLESQ